MERLVIFPIGDSVLDVSSVEQAVADPALSARSTFIGTVRDESFGKRSTHLEYEAYPPMAVAELHRIAGEALERWPKARIAIAHRIGRLEIGEASVVVAVAAGSPPDAIGAMQLVIDELKLRVPIWKKEFGPDGSHWVEGPGEHRSG